MSPLSVRWTLAFPATVPRADGQRAQTRPVCFIGGHGQFEADRTEGCGPLASDRGERAKLGQDCDPNGAHDCTT